MLPDGNAIFQKLQPMPTIEEEQWVVKMIVGEDVLQVVFVGYVEKLLQRANAGDAAELCTFQPLNRGGCHFGESPRRVIVAIDLGGSGLRRKPRHLVAKAHGHIAPTPMLILLQKGDNRLRLDWCRLKTPKLGEIDHKD